MEGCMQRERLKLKKKEKNLFVRITYQQHLPRHVKKNERNGDSLNVIIAEKKKKN